MFSKFKNALHNYSAATINHEQSGIYKYRRKQPPVHYSVKIESFSSVKEKFDSDVFEAQDHKWRLCLYPNGGKDNKSGSQKRENDYISLYLTIVETDAYPSGWKVHVDFKLFLFDEKQDNYLTVQDANGMVRCFNEKKTEWGFRRAISKEDFHNPSNGFHINDTCVLGCEVFVIQSSIVENTPKFGYHVDCPYIFTWDVKTFSKRNHWKYIQSEMFPVGKLAWTLTVYPKGQNREGDVALCLYLHYIQDLPSGKAIFVKYKMLILNNDKSSNNLEKASSGSVQFSKGTSRYEENFITLKDLQEPSNGFIINDTLTVQAVVFVL